MPRTASLARFVSRALKPGVNLVTALPLSVVIGAATAYFGSAWIGAVVFVLALLTVLFGIEGGRMQRAFDAGPNLRFVDTEVAEAGIAARTVASSTIPWTASDVSSVVTAPTSGPELVRVHRFARVRVVNEPRPGARGIRADRVAATLDFMKPDGTPILPGIAGRWAETIQRAETGRLGLSLEEAQLDIDPNGLSHPLDIAMKRQDDEFVYAYNFENSHAEDLALPKHEISEPCPIHVRVTLRPANGDAVVGRFLDQRGEGRVAEPDTA
jgi:hypothetical protein